MTTGHEAHDRHVERFGRWARSYDSSPLQRVLFGPIQKQIVERAASVSPAPGSILDVGCGTGQLLGRMARSFPQARLVGVDPAAGMIAAARASASRDSRATFVEAYAESLPFEDATFGLVTTTMSFHHWSDQPAALREVARVLAPGGAFLLADALAAGWFSWIFVRHGHGTFNTPDRLGEMFGEAGFVCKGFERVDGLGGTIQIAIGRAPAPSVDG